MANRKPNQGWDNLRWFLAVARAGTLSGGERVVAFVVPQTGEMIDPAEISAYCAPWLVNYKCPSEVRVLEQLPLTAAHKLDRAALRRAGRGEEPPPA